MNTEFLKKIFEQSFLVVALATVCYFVVVEYKSLHLELIKKSNRDEELLIQRLMDLNNEKNELYERLIKSNCVEDGRK